MTPIPPDEWQSKLRIIAGLPWGELEGWHWLVTGRGKTSRPAFNGELAALHDRARALGKELK